MIGCTQLSYIYLGHGQTNIWVYGVKKMAPAGQKLGPRDSNVTVVSTPYSLVYISAC